MARIVSKFNAGLILNHMRGTPETWAKLPPMKDPVETIRRELEASVHRAVRAGIDRAHLVIDPGLGFGKRGEQNYEILARLGELAAIDLPVLAGASRKQFLKQSTGRGTEFATAHLVRIHDVEAMAAAAAAADQIATWRTP
jgi:dihydropteroate synthase